MPSHEHSIASLDPTTRQLLCTIHSAHSTRHVPTLLPQVLSHCPKPKDFGSAFGSEPGTFGLRIFGPESCGALSPESSPCVRQVLDMGAACKLLCSFLSHKP